MNIEGIGAVADNLNLVNRRAGLQQEDFLKVLLAQLSFQDPLKPLDNNEFIAQFAQMTSLAETQQLNNKLEALLEFQTGDQAVSLLGRSVEVNTETSRTIGQVTSVIFKKGVPTLVVLTQSGDSLVDVTLGQIVVVR